MGENWNIHFPAVELAEVCGNAFKKASNTDIDTQAEAHTESMA